MANDILSLRCFAEKLAAVARAHTVINFRRGLSVTAKADESPVTAADKAAEMSIRAMLAEHRPNDGILSEEFESYNLSAEYVWVIDPIDGTRSFISGSPLYCTLIGLVRDGIPIIGVVDAPILAERWVGVVADGQCGAWFNDEPCCVAQLQSLPEAVLATTTIGMLDDADESCLLRLTKAAGHTRLGGDGYNYGCLASGYLALAVDGLMQAYDYLPLVPVVVGGGGVISDWQGAPLLLPENPPDGTKTVLASATAPLHEQALAVLA